MRAANRFKVTRRPDHVVLYLGFSTSEDPTDPGDTVEEVLLPITTTTSLVLELFESVIRSTYDLTAFFTAVQGPLTNLNTLSAEIERKKVELALDAGAAAAAGKT